MPAPIKLLITGANGQLGQSFAKVAGQNTGFEMALMGSADLDITDSRQLEAAVKELQPDAIINCAAYTAVDHAEDNPTKADQVNATAVDEICKVCKKYEILLIHYSSDYVYHSITDRPLAESDHTVPQGIYAQSKLSGEQLITSRLTQAVVIRTSWVYSEFGNNFVKTMLRLSESHDKLNIVSDQIGAPTYAPDIAETTLKIVEEVLTKEVILDQSLVLNYAGAGQTSWSDFARYIFEIVDAEVSVSDITTKEYGAKAPRPLWSVLDMTKLKTIFGIAPKYWKASVSDCLETLTTAQQS